MRPEVASDLRKRCDFHNEWTLRDVDPRAGYRWDRFGSARSGETANPLAERIYVVWSGAILAWAIDGDGPLDTWIRDRIDHAIASTTT